VHFRTATASFSWHGRGGLPREGQIMRGGHARQSRICHAGRIYGVWAAACSRRDHGHTQHFQPVQPARDGALVLQHTIRLADPRHGAQVVADHQNVPEEGRRVLPLAVDPAWQGRLLLLHRCARLLRVRLESLADLRAGRRARWGASRRQLRSSANRDRGQ